jgi:hypothetical protein
VDIAFSFFFLNFYDYYLFSTVKGDFLLFAFLFLISIIIYAIREIKMKRIWRISDAFEKSYEQWNIIFHDLPMPCFVLNKKFEILALNAKGWNFLKKYGQQNNLNSFVLSNTENFEGFIEMKEECLLNANVLTKKFKLISNEKQKEKIFEFCLSKVV